MTRVTYRPTTIAANIQQPARNARLPSEGQRLTAGSTNSSTPEPERSFPGNDPALLLDQADSKRRFSKSRCRGCWSLNLAIARFLLAVGCSPPASIGPHSPVLREEPGFTGSYTDSWASSPGCRGNPFRPLVRWWSPRLRRLPSRRCVSECTSARVRRRISTS